MYLTYLDSNSWLIELGGKRILLDPWLVGDLVFGNTSWLIRGIKQTSRPLPENIDLILLSQGLNDHAHIPTLEKLDRNIPVVTSISAAKIVEGLGYTNITALPHGATHTIDSTIEIKAVAGSLVGANLIENGYILKELTTGKSLYYEPHGSHSPELKELAPIDVIITPILDFKLLFLPFIKGQKNALEVCKWLQPKVIISTAVGGDVKFEGILISLLRLAGSIADFKALLTANNLDIEVIDPKSGERFATAIDN
jgi:L-ascorbate metabolism protein UlaG (beta-lactamase superfamily)